MNPDLVILLSQYVEIYYVRYEKRTDQAALQQKESSLTLFIKNAYSLSRFKSKFKETVGITPAEYVTMQKIELAKRRLIEGEESIAELAYNLGYSSSNYFCSVFKKMMNCSPQNYRLRYRSKPPK